MFPRFFIDRPIFASVLSIVITIVGGLAVFRLPLSQYPPVTPPTIQVDCNYPGASAQVVADTIAAPIEQQVNGVEEMLYMSSQCTSDGSYTLTVTFKIGTNLNMAQVLVQNRVNLAMPNLPDIVRATGVTMRKRSPEILLTISVHSPTNRYSQLYLSNYALCKIREEMARVPGIADVLIFGQRDYAMRLWVDPTKLSARNLTALDVVNAVKSQNSQIATGKIGQPPTDDGQTFQFTLDTLGRLTTVEEFENIVVKATSQGQVVRVKDVARVELAPKSEDVTNRFDRKPTIGIAVFLIADANALETSDHVKAKMEEMKLSFPEGLDYEIGFDTTPFIWESIKEVAKSLRDAIILVAIVVLVFLQSWRSALIPLAAVPVAIIGTFGAMAAVGFSLNHLTLFGLVLSVGIVVDDAIVVVEAVQHQIEKGFPPREATLRAMEDVGGPIIAVGVVLGAVFVPCAFLEGIVGQFFRQFALTIAISALISCFNSLTLSPALCALLLQPKQAGVSRPLPKVTFELLGAALGFFFIGPKALSWLQDTFEPLRQHPELTAWTVKILSGCVGILAGRLVRNSFFWLFDQFFVVFNAAFDFSGRTYVRIVGLLVYVPLAVILVYAAAIGAGVWGYVQMPTGFIPQQDKGYLIASIQLPDAASVERTMEVMDKLGKIALETKGVRHVNGVSGNSFVLSAYGSNFGSMFIILDTYDKRPTKNLYSDNIAATLRQRFANEIPEATVAVFGAPAVSGLGRAGGFRLMVEDRGQVGPRMLQSATDAFIEHANKNPAMNGLFTVYKYNSPQIYLDVNRSSCMMHGVDPIDVFNTLNATMGSRYVNDFNYLGRTWQVLVQAESKFRGEKEDIGRIKVRNASGGMVPLGALVKVQESYGPLVITRYNTYAAAPVNGNFADGVSSGDASAILEKLADDDLPGNMVLEWSELVFVEKLSKGTGMMIFGVSVAFVFLVLSALYESWIFPFAVILVVPMCVVSSIVGVAMANLDVNIFTQVGFVVLIGLACKNAILIVEFAKMKRDAGAERREAVLGACALRFRPILMTSFAFILGVLPLLYSKGAGAEMRVALGTAVFSGMVGVTLFGIFLTPIFYWLVDGVQRGNQSHGVVKPLYRFVKREIIALTALRTASSWTIAKVTACWRKLARIRVRSKDSPNKPTPTGS